MSNGGGAFHCIALPREGKKGEPYRKMWLAAVNKLIDAVSDCFHLVHMTERHYLSSRQEEYRK